MNPNKENHFNPTFAGPLLKMAAPLHFLAPSTFYPANINYIWTFLKQKGYN